MQKTIKARYTHGRIEPLEPLTLPEDTEVEVTLNLAPSPVDQPDPTTASAGAWNGLLDAEQLEEDIYRSRLLQTRPEPAL